MIWNFLGNSGIFRLWATQAVVLPQVVSLFGEIITIHKLTIGKNPKWKSWIPRIFSLICHFDQFHICCLKWNFWDAPIGIYHHDCYEVTNACIKVGSIPENKPLTAIKQQASSVYSFAAITLHAIVFTLLPTITVQSHHLHNLTPWICSVKSPRPVSQLDSISLKLQDY